MKRRFFTIAFLALGAITFVSCSDDDDDNSHETMIEAQDLPENARTFISTYFPTAEYSRVEENSAVESDGTMYEVDLSNNFEIDFTSEGSWVDVDGNDQELPAGIVPQKIAEYVSENYPDFFITGIDTETTGYEIELSNDLDVLFDTEENFISEDK
ncbi:hypothetical protein GCM10007103_14750 [Salinimicrobium marinum]|uniref:Putative beta-lactamase-inhibitor-like PepSY-like domain-containing protein n=1 Tax=Salinimicrobium marinum TaxID=680283 RepID=A0A918VYE5_9FLAO|nr:PepSY-like domain-containing protein [Salinimicrobium marinum]GHA34381.1 hypothetical protein GCM10007103_14750 [Salinimicrobium marinum]